MSRRVLAWWLVQKSLALLLSTYSRRFNMIMAEIVISSDDDEYTHSIELFR
jgi:hypothetical protein